MPPSEQPGRCGADATTAGDGRRGAARRQVSDEEIYLVVNAGCVEKDLAHIESYLNPFKVRPHTCEGV
jgi:glycine cleavage system aminomethyltransferase T